MRVFDSRVSHFYTKAVNSMKTLIFKGLRLFFYLLILNQIYDFEVVFRKILDKIWTRFGQEY